MLKSLCVESIWRKPSTKDVYCERICDRPHNVRHESRFFASKKIKKCEQLIFKFKNLFVWIS